MTQARFTYGAHGLIFASEIELPDFTPVLPGTPAEVSIEVASLRHANAADEHWGGARYTVAGKCLWFEAPGVGRFSIEGGSRILIDREPGPGSEAAVPILTGTALAATALLRGLLPFHAGCAVRDTKAFAFAGPSGIGKSTLAAYLGRRGWQIFSDDMTVVHPDVSGSFIFPGLRRMKLWRDTAERNGLTAENLPSVPGGRDKYFVPLAQTAELGSRATLKAIYLIEDRLPDEDDEISCLPAAAAIAFLLRQTYRPELLPNLGIENEYMRRIVALLAHVTCYRFPRARGIANMEAEAERLIAHISAQGNKGGARRSAL